MRIRQPFSIAVLATTLLISLLPAQSAKAADSAEQILAISIRARAARPVPESLVQREAMRIATALTPEQRSALLAGTLAADELTAAAPHDGRQSASPGGSPKVLGDAESDLLFVPLPPCRIIDTRFGGGALAANETRDFLVAGTGFGGQGGEAAGCGVPLSGDASPIASSVAINFIAVGPAGPGNLRAWEFSQPIPNASVLNYSNVSGLNIANGVIVPIAGVVSLPLDLSIRADVSGTHVVADVSGYFTRFPVERVKSTVVSSLLVFPVALSDGLCHQLLTCTVQRPVAGRVVIATTGAVLIEHAAGALDQANLDIDTADPVTCASSVTTTRAQVPAALPTFAGLYPAVVAFNQDFAVLAGAPIVYRLWGRMIAGASASDQIDSGLRMICTFIPG